MILLPIIYFLISYLFIFYDTPQDTKKQRSKHNKRKDESNNET